MVLRVRSIRPQLLIDTPTQRVQVNCVDGDPRSEDAVLFPMISSRRRFHRQVRAIRQLFDLSADNENNIEIPKNARLTDVLTALHCWQAGFALRDIASAIYSEEIVTRDWAPEGGYLIERVRRSIRRGRALMEGGYRSLLE